MKRISRRFKRHFNTPSRRVAVKLHRAWYWQALAAILLVGIGYLLAYWHLTVGGKFSPTFVKPVLTDEVLLAKVVFAERQLQVQRAVQEGLAKELAAVQDESMKLKENVTFYQGILEESANGDRVRLNSFKLEKGKTADRYQYHVVLSQQGSHNKAIQGALKFVLEGTDEKGDQIKLVLKHEPAANAQANVNFRYYQRMDGSFTLPPNIAGQGVEVSFLENGAKQPYISQKVDLPD
ncbi:hypothetical protein LG201_10630 [Methylobacillus gramineus]|uniref:DUF6776 family protein n=1 Tax=Methylobacillus gramineus TaxID=755169 RepID=UPI001CFFA7E3|nr:DUF6776 family protein [Methylobacillus gramineus]MCB5185655.1 hypothetical protein [Methylobacillus gramineus]